MCITKSALPLELLRSHGATVSLMVPRLGLIISPRQASSLTTLYIQGHHVPVRATVRTLQALSTMYLNQMEGRLNGSTKSLNIRAARLFMPSAITLRWSGIRRNRSVVRPHPPVLIHTAFCCVATILQATIRMSCLILQQLHQTKP